MSLYSELLRLKEQKKWVCLENRQNVQAFGYIKQVTRDSITMEAYDSTDHEHLGTWISETDNIVGIQVDWRYLHELALSASIDADKLEPLDFPEDDDDPEDRRLVKV